MAHGPRYTALVAALPASVPFVGPEAQERARGAAFEARIGANENGFGPAPSVVKAIAEASSQLWMYADPENHDLKEALCAHLSVPRAHLTVGEGIDALLGYLVRMLIEKGDRVVTSDGAYPTFNFHVAGYGGELVKVPYDGAREDPVALVEKAREVGAKIVYLANPDNPMASYNSGAAIETMIEALPEGCLLVLDEAYVEFAPQDALPKIDPNDPRVVRFRTFSKAYGLAGGRVAYAISAPELAQSFEKVRNHFGMNRAAQIGALAALKDQAWLGEMLSQVEAARARISAIAAANGLKALPSATNFVTIDCGHDGDFARALLKAISARGVFIRMPFVAPHDRCIRVSCGPEADLAAFERALPEALAEVRAAL